MTVWAARVLMRIGIAMLLMCLVLRPAIATPDGAMASNLAIIACALLIIVGVVVVGLDRRGSRSGTGDS